MQELRAFGDAEKFYKRTISLKADHHMSWYNLGYLYQEKRLWDESVRCFEEAARISPHDVDTQINLGNCLCTL